MSNDIIIKDYFYIEGNDVFKEANKNDLCQVSLTGIRSLVLLGLLIDRPLSLDEIRKEFLKYNIIDDTSSYDILRIDLNTLRSMGCEISRAKKSTNNKFVLTVHPFMLDITEDEIRVLKQAFSRLKSDLNLTSAINFHRLFIKIAKNVKNPEVAEELHGLSPIKHYNLELIDKVQNYCKERKILNFIYKSPAEKDEIQKTVVCKEVMLKNNKIYLYCYDSVYKKNLTLNLDRIKRIISCQDNNGDDDNTVGKIKVEFKLKEFGIQGLSEDEKILEGDLKSGFLIEGNYYNEFLAYQRILSFGANCTVIEPKDFKQNIIKKLKKMKEIYTA